MEPIITTADLCKSFGENRAVDNLTLAIEPGEVFGVLGHNGAGKTTTVRLLNGVLSPSGGSAQVLGLSPERDGPTLRSRTGVLTETPSLDERLTGRDNLTIYGDLYGYPVDQVSDRVDELLARFELTERADDKVNEYSKGMRQRLALARALLHKPELLFLDEPTAGLDPVASRQVHQLIAHLSQKEGRTVFLCTHNLTEAQNLCDRVAVLEHGRLLAVGTPAELGRQIAGSQRFILEIEPDQMERTAAILETIRNPEGQPIPFEIGDNNLVSLIGIEREQVPDIVAWFVAEGIRIYSFSLKEPSLEQVYFALHEQGESH